MSELDVDYQLNNNTFLKLPAVLSINNSSEELATFEDTDIINELNIEETESLGR